MARCLNPITIKRPGFTDAPHALPRYARERLRPYMYDTIVVPCGKCLSCLKNKQSQMVVRCKREAQKRGSFAFVTLTYDDEHLPLTRSLFRINKDTGEEEIYYKPEFISTGYHPNIDYLQLFTTIVASDSPRYQCFTLFEDSEFSYEVRVTPSVCRLDVRTWLKTSRIQYERDFGKKLPYFSYVAISEYGPKTCRPHYHLAFFGLGKQELNWIVDRWKFATVKKVQFVNQVNADKSDGWARAAQYIGKYMSKGKFECLSVKDGSAEKPRVCQSIGLGTKDLEAVERFVLCQDIVGKYDPDTLRFTDSQEHLTEKQIDLLCEEIPKRLIYKVSSEVKNESGLVVKSACILPLPRIIRDKIFKVSNRYGDKTKKAPTTLWALVTASLRDKSIRESNERFEQFCSLHPEREMFENCAEFAYWEAFSFDVKEKTMYEDYRSFYSKSLF